MSRSHHPFLAAAFLLALALLVTSCASSTVAPLSVEGGRQAHGEAALESTADDGAVGSSATADDPTAAEPEPTAALIVEPTETAAAVMQATATPQSTEQTETAEPTAAPAATATTAPTQPTATTATSQPVTTPTPKPTAASATRPTSAPTAKPKPTATTKPKPSPTAAVLIATATPPPTSAPSATPRPSVTPQPTATAVPAPTATAQPTLTPQPPPTATATDAGGGLQPEGVDGPNPSGPRFIPVTNGIGVAMGGGIFDLSDAELFEQFKTLADGGVTWVRIDVDWSWIERSRGTYDWAETDLIIDAARFEGLDVIGIITYTPSWARPAGTTDKYPPTNRGDFAAFAGRVAARYKSQVKHWEVWNEPNHLPFWESGADPISYGDLLAVSAASIKQADPNAFVISGGMSPAVDSGGSLSPETFIRGFMPRVPDRLLDAVGIHPYSFPALPSDSSLPWNTFGRLPEMKALAQSYDAGVELWATEFGAPTDVVSPAVQAAHIEDAINCIEKWSWAGPIMLFTYEDFGSTDAFGLFTNSGSPKPAWETVTDLAHFGPDPASCPL